MGTVVEIKRNTHLILKYEHIRECLTAEEREHLNNLTDKIVEKHGNHCYVVCNIDEPYYARVHKLILDGEAEKLK